jgi:hypothetical protein
MSYYELCSHNTGVNSHYKVWLTGNVSYNCCVIIDGSCRVIECCFSLGQSVTMLEHQTMVMGHVHNIIHTHNNALWN